MNEEQQQYYAEMDRIVESYVSYSGDEDTAILYSAFALASQAHQAQRRESGESYISHPLAVAEILIDIKVDKETLIAALLHDVVEDTQVKLEDIRTQFGDTVAELVDGVTKLGRITYSSKEEMQAQNFRKMFLAMAKDIRVVIIKLADRLHNMRTMKHKKSPEKQLEKAHETLDIYAPLAHRLGIYKVKWELEDLALRFIDPDAYYELVGAIAQKRSDREHFLENIVVQLNTKIAELGIETEIEGRPKHFYSIYKKMKSQHKSLDEIYDLFACRVIVPTVGDCYAVLGLVHELYTPMPGRFKDYIAMPKANMYQSLHTTVLGPNGTPFEVQIRTYEMHRIAEYGIAAHWRYKEGVQARDANKNAAVENKLVWLRQLLEWSNDMNEAGAYLDSLKEGLIEDEVFVFTPKGDVVSLPMGSCPIDFAYHIHSAVGNSMFGARVNGHMVPLDYQLQNGDIIEIQTSDKVKGPSRDWLNLVRSTTAKTKISAFFKKEMRSGNIVRGRELLDEKIRASHFSAAQILQKPFLEKIFQRFTLKNMDDLYASIGYGGLAAGRVVPLLRDEYIRSLSDEERAKLGYRLGRNGVVIFSPKAVLSREDLLAEKHPSILHKEREKSKSQIVRSEKHGYDISVRGMSGMLVKLAHCCNPVPGDEIIGFITRGTGVTVHRMDCSNIRHIMSAAENSPRDAERASRLIEVSWGEEARNKNFDVALTIYARDRNHLLADISNAIAEEKISILSGKIQSAKDFTATLNMVVQVSEQSQLDKLLGRLKAIEGVIDVERAQS